ncbi:MAG TPA: hypothetical protein PKY82_16400 [Pyrinomonadaceae bacterium]|nr:hypothetical protein [Pyrinomonadaceae bacterium]
MATGRLRAEIINLRGSSIEIKDGHFFIKAKVKGGFFLNFELNDEATKNVLFEYLEATNRTDIFGQDEPPLLRHDKGAKSNKLIGLSSNRFAQRMKIYLLEAGIKNFQLHRLKRSFAKFVSEHSKSISPPNCTVKKNHWGKLN